MGRGVHFFELLKAEGRSIEYYACIETITSAELTIWYVKRVCKKQAFIIYPLRYVMLVREISPPQLAGLGWVFSLQLSKCFQRIT